MPQIIEANLIDGGGRYAIIVSRFNDFITARLLEGSLDCLRRHGVDIEARATIIWAPGAYELPMVAQRVARTGRFDAVIGLAAVIRGSTPHFDYVSSEVAKGLAHVALSEDIPVIFGVLTTDTIEQSIERAGTKMGNKGAEAAMAALEMVGLMTAIGAPASSGE